MIGDVIPMALWGHHVILTETLQGWSICILQLHSVLQNWPGFNTLTPEQTNSPRSFAMGLVYIYVYLHLLLEIHQM